MSTVKNRVQLTGNVGKAPEIRTFEKGRKMAKFSIATDESYKTSSGEWVSNTQWHNVIAWGKTAEKVEEQLTKGSSISLEGKLLNNSYTDKDGHTRYSTQVQVSDFVVIKREVPQEA